MPIPSDTTFPNLVARAVMSNRYPDLPSDKVPYYLDISVSSTEFLHYIWHPKQMELIVKGDQFSPTIRPDKWTMEIIPIDLGLYAVMWKAKCGNRPAFYGLTIYNSVTKKIREVAGANQHEHLPLITKFKLFWAKWISKPAWLTYWDKQVAELVDG